MASVKTLYLASVLESDTVGCILLVHAMLEFPMRCSVPEMERLVSVSALVGIDIGIEGNVAVGIQHNTVIFSTVEIVQHLLCGLEVHNFGILHVACHATDCVTNVRPCVGEVDQTADQRSVLSGVCLRGFQLSIERLSCSFGSMGSLVGLHPCI